MSFLRRDLGVFVKAEHYLNPYCTQGFLLRLKECVAACVGLTGEEYLAATTHTTQPGLYPSTSRSAIFSQAQQLRAAAAAAAASSNDSGGSNNGSQGSSSGGGGHPSSVAPPPRAAVGPAMPPTPVLYSIHVPEDRTRCVQHGAGGGGDLPPKYEDVCFDVWWLSGMSGDQTAQLLGLKTQLLSVYNIISSCTNSR